MAIKKTPRRSGSQTGYVKNRVVLEPAGYVPMTEEQSREMVEIMADLIDSYIARHQADPPRTPGVNAGSDPDEPQDEVPIAERQDLLGRAVAIWLARPDPRTYVEGQLTATEAQIRQNKQATDRYLRGFETGKLPEEETLTDRVQELKRANTALRRHKKELTAQLHSMTSQRNADCLEGVSVAEFLQDVFDAHGNLPIVKRLLRVQIDQLLLDGLNARLVIRVPPETYPPASPAGHRSLSSPWVIADSIWGLARWSITEHTPDRVVAARSSEQPEGPWTIDLSDALRFASSHRWSILATIRRHGRPQLSTVGHLVCPDGLVRISVTADRAKYHNLIREPWAALHITRDDFYAYVVIEGDVELSPVAASPDDPVVDELVEHYQYSIGEHEDWDTYRAAMVAERRAVIRLTPTRAYGMLPPPPVDAA